MVWSLQSVGSKEPILPFTLRLIFASILLKNRSHSRQHLIISLLLRLFITKAEATCFTLNVKMQLYAYAHLGLYLLFIGNKIRMCSLIGFIARASANTRQKNDRLFLSIRQESSWNEFSGKLSFPSNKNLFVPVYLDNLHGKVKKNTGS